MTVSSKGILPITEILQLTTDAFMALEVQKLIPLHCTGFRATAGMFWKMKDKCIIAGAGDVLEL
jgi:metal-dependent hydrolase (beta-lactamase superfamily II)